MRLSFVFSRAGPRRQAEKDSSSRSAAQIRLAEAVATTAAHPIGHLDQAVVYFTALAKSAKASFAYFDLSVFCPVLRRTFFGHFPDISPTK